MVSEVSVTMAYKSKDIRRLLLQEQRRGTKRARPDPEEIEKQKEIERATLDFIRTINSRKDFIKALTDHFGLQVGSSQFARCLDAWNEYQRFRKKS